jgi:glycosyltransferase involved in cell wall biosynthesis
VPGSEELIRHGENGYITAPGAHSELAQALRLLIDSPEHRAELGARSQHIAHAYSWKSVAEQYLTLYKKMLLQKTGHLEEESIVNEER